MVQAKHILDRYVSSIPDAPRRVASKIILLIIDGHAPSIAMAVLYYRLKTGFSGAILPNVDRPG